MPEKRVQQSLIDRTCLAVASCLVAGLLMVAFVSPSPQAASAQETANAAAIDGTPPVISILADVVAPAVDASGASVTYALPAVTDDVDGALTPVCLPAAGAIFPLGVTPVTCTATDSAGNQSSVVAFNIIVVDQQAPTIEQPSSIALVANDATGMAVSYPIPVASDTISGPAAVSCAPGPGAWFPIGATVVICTAADASGNVTSVSFTVTIEAPAAPTETPTDEPVPTETATATATAVESETPEPTGEVTETPDGEEPAASATATAPPETPTSSPSPSPTPVTTPAALPLPQTQPPPANPIYGSGPIDSLALIWGGLDFPISQEYGHTEFSLAQETLYLYGLGLGLDGRAHPGLDIAMPAGTYLYSPVNGTVIISGGVPFYTYYGNGEPGVGELLIETDAGDHVILGHMAAISVNAGQRVTTGQFVGLSGGDNGDHLHLETRDFGILAVDPRKSFIVEAIAAYTGVDDEPTATAAASTDEANDVGGEPDPASADQGPAVTNEPQDQGAAVTGEPSAGTATTSGSSRDLLENLLTPQNSPYRDRKTELIGEFLSTRSVIANQ